MDLENLEKYKATERQSHQKALEAGVEVNIKKRINAAILDCRKGMYIAFPVIERLSEEEQNKFGIDKKEFKLWMDSYKKLVDPNNPDTLIGK